MLIVHESKLIKPSEIPKGHFCLYIRRDVLPSGAYKEYSYVGPEAEVAALASRCVDLDMNQVEELLRKGHSFEAALEELGR